MRKPGLVASDVDGTLLDPWERISARTRRSVQRIATEQTPFVLATGRPPRWVPRIARGLGVDGIAVCSNGAEIYDVKTDHVVHSRTIDPVTLHDVAHELERAIPGCTFSVERPTGRGPHDSNERSLAEEGFGRVWPYSDILLVTRDELVGKPAVKLLVLHEKLTSDEMVQIASELVGSRLQLTYSTGTGLLELSSPGVDKASGLALVASEHGVSQSEVIAFGDMPNDIPMLNWAGHGVAMRHAHSTVLEIADEVTGTNQDDGVAQVLERWW